MHRTLTRIPPSLFSGFPSTNDQPHTEEAPVASRAGQLGGGKCIVEIGICHARGQHLNLHRFECTAPCALCSGQAEAEHRAAGEVENFRGPRFPFCLKWASPCGPVTTFPGGMAEKKPSLARAVCWRCCGRLGSKSEGPMRR